MLHADGYCSVLFLYFLAKLYDLVVILPIAAIAVSETYFFHGFRINMKHCLIEDRRNIWESWRKNN